MKKIRKLIGEEIHDYLEESLKWVVMSPVSYTHLT